MEGGGVGFYLDGASLTCNISPFDQPRALRAIAWRNPGQRFDSFSLEKEVTKEQEGLLFSLVQQLRMERV